MTSVSLKFYTVVYKDMTDRQKNRQISSEQMFFL